MEQLLLDHMGYVDRNRILLKHARLSFDHSLDTGLDVGGGIDSQVLREETGGITRPSLVTIPSNFKDDMNLIIMRTIRVRSAHNPLVVPLGSDRSFYHR